MLSSGQPQGSDLPEHNSQIVRLNTLGTLDGNVRFCLGGNGHNTVTEKKIKGYLKLKGLTWNTFYWKTFSFKWVVLEIFQHNFWMHKFLMQWSPKSMSTYSMRTLRCRFQKYIKISEMPLKIQLSKTVTTLQSRNPCACSLTSIIKHSLPSIKTSCLRICLHVSVEARGCHHPVYNPPIQLCFNIHNDVKHARLIYYLVILPQ